jgi:hypothetical protein
LRFFAASLLLPLLFLSSLSLVAEENDLPAAPEPQQTQSAQQSSTETTQEKAKRELDAEKHQRILGVVPNFNTVIGGHATPLTPKQKFNLALHSSVDPFVFFAAGLTAGIGQASDNHSGYDEGAEGYAKRFGAAYADSFDGTILGNAVFPILLHQDSRYYRKGEGSFKSRLGRALGSTIICKGDNGNWQPNFSNVLGNFAAGGISNLYYPSEDRGAGLTAQNALTVTAQGAVGSLFVEFWPDIQRHFAEKRARKRADKLAAQEAH